MTLINLTEECARLGSNLLERIFLGAIPDIYKSSSLSQINISLNDKPLRKKVFFSKTAYIFLENIDIREVDRYEGQTYFELKDFSGPRVALWKGGNERCFSREKRKWGFNEDSFVRIPEICLVYKETNYDPMPGNGYLLLKKLFSERTPKPLKERIAELVGKGREPTLKPA